MVIRLVDLDVVYERIPNHGNIFGRIFPHINHEIFGPLVIASLQFNLQIARGDKEVGHIPVLALMLHVVGVFIVVPITIRRGRHDIGGGESEEVIQHFQEFLLQRAHIRHRSTIMEFVFARDFTVREHSLTVLGICQKLTLRFTVASSHASHNTISEFLFANFRATDLGIRSSDFIPRSLSATFPAVTTILPRIHKVCIAKVGPAFRNCAWVLRSHVISKCLILFIGFTADRAFQIREFNHRKANSFRLTD